jgi:hypothetical protein
MSAGEKQQAGGGRAPSTRAHAGDAAVSESTRFMCVGAYIDEQFAKEVQNQLNMQDVQALAPSYGVDVSVLGQHAQEASARVASRDRAVGISWLVALVTIPVLALVWLLVMKVRYFSLGLMSSPPSGRGSPNPRIPGMHTWRASRVGGLRVETPVRQLIQSLAIWGVLVVAVGVISPLWTFSYLPLPLEILVLLVCLILVPWLAGWRHQEAVWEALEQLRPKPGAVSGPPAGNVVIYSGFRPFVGSGSELNSWALDLRLLPAQGPDGTPLQTTPIGIEELLTALREGMEDLRRGPTAVPGLSVREQVFVDGRELDGPAPFTAATFLRSSGSHHPVSVRPVTVVPDEVVAAARGKIEGPVRHCLTAQVEVWSGDVILSVHVQAAIAPHTLHLYTTASVLPPVRDEYREIDRLTAEHGIHHRLRVMASASSAAQSSLAQPVARLVQQIFGPARAARRLQEIEEVIRYDKRFDFGARQSLREQSASPNYANYFQRLDVRRWNSQIELRVVSVLSALLEEHGWDSGELEEGRKVLLNNGIIMTGGAMHGAIAAGTEARATMKNEAGSGSGRAGRPAGALTPRS